MGFNVNGWIDGKVLDLLEAAGVPMPGGDGDILREIASGWDAAGTNLTNIASDLDSSVRSTDEHGWSGTARQAFDQHWAKQKKAIDDLAGNMHKVATGLRSYANEIDNINKAIIDICLQIAEMEVGGVLLSFVTAGISDLLANTAVAERIAKVADLVKLFTSAAEKVSELLGEFFELSEETAATMKSVLTTVAKVLGETGKTTLNSFATNFASNMVSGVAGQALNGQKIDLRGDIKDASLSAAGSAAFDGLGGGLVASGKVSGGIADVFSGEGMMGSSVSGALSNVAGGLVDDAADHTSGSDVAWDVGSNLVTGAAGGAAGAKASELMEEHGLIGGENRSDRAKLADSAFDQSVGNSLGTAISVAGSGIQSDVQELTEDSST